MKPKSALFISAALTAFVLAIVGSVFAAYNTAQTSQVAAAASPTEMVAVTDLPTQQPAATATTPADVGPVQAASLAAAFMNKTDVYSVESATLNGVNVYKVVFSSGDVVFLGLDGKIISTSKLQPTTIVSNIPLPTPAPKKHNGGGGGGGHEHEKEGDD